MIIDKKDIIYKEFAAICPSPSKDDEVIIPKKLKKDKSKKVKNEKKGKVKKEKGGKKKKKRENEKNLNITVPGEVFFTDPYFTEYKSSSNETVAHFSIVINVYDLLSEDLKLKLTPFIIKINQIINFPASYLKSLG